MVDTFAHAAISYLLFRKWAKKKRDILLSMLFGTLSDLASWTVYLIYLLISGNFLIGRPSMQNIPEWVFTLYGISHSIFVYGLVLLIVYLFIRRIPIYLWAWGLHIVIDIPTHSREFLSTPFLWPISVWHFPGISWGTSWFFLSYWLLIIFGFILVLWEKIMHNKKNK